VLVPIADLDVRVLTEDGLLRDYAGARLDAAVDDRKADAERGEVGHQGPAFCLHGQGPVDLGGAERTLQRDSVRLCGWGQDERGSGQVAQLQRAVAGQGMGRRQQGCLWIGGQHDDVEVVGQHLQDADAQLRLAGADRVEHVVPMAGAQA
jgi:hypothetical protein